ncbi:hypothetical protein PHYPSEUDO_011596 [Phytophthora pseudosyringae]|uniref:C3H1-type domain-containing protein n=1 Tax=Phytophthora pseudosyringae TaxID=221518 RepID=A0A8T1WB89_9STRA|nr:hypothetical protein PHYPSEUDO_011596 [Phytophthora pseudosyringae]
MGGHEHHREGHKSSRSGAWEGFEKLKQALEGLATAKGVSQSRIGAVAKLAAHYSKFYKHVVHDIEVFLWKAEVEHRLAGLYAIDAIIKQSHAKNDPKDAYVKRFLIRLSDTFVAVKQVPEQFQPKVRHVIEEWQKRGIYTHKQIEDVGGHEYLLQGQEGNVTPRASPGKLASLLSIIKQKKEEKEHASDQQGRPPNDDSYDRVSRPRDDAGDFNRRSYGERQGEDQRYDRRDVGGIMGDAPGVPVGNGRMRRGPDDRPSDLDNRDPKKARGSRWGPPKLDNPSIDRPAPIITSLDREGDYRPEISGRSGNGSPPGSSRQAPLLQSPRGGQPRHKEWNRSAPSSRGSGSGWPLENVRSPQSGRLGGHESNPYDQGGMQQSQQSPFSGSDDRRSPGNRVPGTSGEVCRNFLAGRCTFGDRCWHIHDPQAASSGGGRSEMTESKRKTVLCNNYPLGKCRFGDKCSFAHGEEELDTSVRFPPRPAARGEPTGGRWQPSPSSRQGMEQSRVSPSANNSSPARSYGAPQVYNEPHGDRGSRGGDSSVSNANAAAPSPGGRRLPPDHQAVSGIPPQGYPGTFTSGSSPFGAAGGSTYATQGLSFSSGDQGRSRVPGSAPVLPAPGSVSQSYGGNQAAAPTPSAKVLADDDDADTAEPEFTLEYDDDD